MKIDLIIILFAFGVAYGTPLQGTQSRSITLGGFPVIDFEDCPSVQVVTGFQTSQYLGEWYAAYANPTFFQSELTACSRASYTNQGGNIVGVWNSGTSAWGVYEEICGFAVQPDSDKGELDVQFFASHVPDNPDPNYRILATDYVSYATVYSCSKFLGFMRQQSAWILTRDRQANATTIGLAKQAFQDNNIDEDSLKLFKMRQDDNCVNDKDGSCSEDNSNLRPHD